MKLHKWTLLLYWLILYLHTSLGQRDCTGVECPSLQNCIEDVLEKGSCCASCMQRGCTCKGYQYYDCAQAGFWKAKVPEGQSYYVDFGSTMCSCPRGGGNISCHYIPCPEVTPNCIDISQPADGCRECRRIGCVSGGRKYDAGHTFQLEPCRVCHCPNSGGKLTCSAIPECGLHSVQSPASNSIPLKDIPHVHDSMQPNPAEPVSKQRLGATLPLYKQDPPSFGTEQYDLTLAEPTNPAPLDVAQRLHSGGESRHTSSSIHGDLAREPTEEHRRRAKAEEHHMTSTASRAQEQTGTLLTTTTTTSSTQGASPATPNPRREGGEKAMRRHTARDGALEGDRRDTTYVTPDDRHTGRHNDRRGHSNMGPEEDLKEDKPAYSTVQLSPTIRGPARSHPHTWHNYQPHNGDIDMEASAKDLMKGCCEKGKKWASANGHCNMELPTKDMHSVCRIAQKQCCLASLREKQCLAGIDGARKGVICEKDYSDGCGIDSFKECCGCCSLGLQLRSEGQSCETPRHLDYGCSHAFLTCCQGDGWHPVREKPYLASTALPKKVNDSPFPREAFSLDEEQGEEGQGEEEQEGENTVEPPVEVEDVDECVFDQGSLCHHRCVNTLGSYRCECFPGYVLQDDGVNCAQDAVDEENRLREDDRVEAAPTTQPLPPQTTRPLPGACRENNPCMQQCAPVEGRPQCSCSAGFSLMADRQSCEDVNECLSPRACQLNERCINTAGSYMCQRHISCSPGYRANSNVCEDINECVQGTHNCAGGFECVNSEGSFRCNPRPQCSLGLREDSHGNCVDMDECSRVAQPCSPGLDCVNTVGSYTCQRKTIMCSRGYHAGPDGTRCVDADECQSNLHRCGDSQMCHNLPGSYRCDCQTGYQYDSFRRTCVDVNECWRYPRRLCSQTCVNTPGSYECSCTAGFRLSADGKTCEDVNECLSSPCGQECANVYGSYQCYCRQGYYLSEDGHTCEDIDECTRSLGHLCTYKCVNVPGSYQCACPDSGYTMSPNGRSCRDIDECATRAHNCSLAETCYNIQGGYRCLGFTCPQNYRKVSDTRCERMSCPNYVECQNSPLRITYYYLSFQSNIVIPAQIFRIGPSPAYAGDNIIVSVTAGNEDGYFSTRKLNTYTGAVYLHRQVPHPRDFLIDVEMKLWRQGSFTTFLAKIYVFITDDSL